MPDKQSLRGLLHGATHRIPGVSAHAEQPAGHQGRDHHGRAWRHRVAHRRRHDHGWNHWSARAPRVLVSWQRRIGALSAREL